MLKISKNKLYFISFILISFSIYLFSNYYKTTYISTVTEKKLINEYFNVDNAKNNQINNNNESKYIGILEIPIINLKKGFYNINDTNNNVNKNIEVLKNSNMPNENGILAIAGHSGNSSKSYFKNLFKLKMEDVIKVYYDNDIYIYKVTKIYEEEKNGKIIVNDDYNNILLLTTCSQSDRTKQIVIIASLITIKQKDYNL